MASQLSGQTAIVTGAARGIGRAIAETLGDRGAAVILADRDNTATDTASELTQNGLQAEAVECDVTDRADTAALAEYVAEEHAGVDILINNAGIGSGGSFTELSPEEWDLVIDVNLTGVFNCCNAIVPKLIENGGGNIVNISSMAGRNVSYHGAANYTASKWGVIGFTKHLAWDLGDHDIRVNAVCPGATRTSMPDEANHEDTAEKIPLNRWAQPEDQAQAVAYLVSDEASYLTGTVLEVDGGKQLSVRHEI
jgi:3-oxoacyl-[acyl-carrier protein] reductase